MSDLDVYKTGDIQNMLSDNNDSLDDDDDNGDGKMR